MQDLAKYSFNAELSDEKALERLVQIENQVSSWLIEKGATSPIQTQGKFISLTGDGAGNYHKKDTTSDAGIFKEYSLTEESGRDQIFTTKIQAIYDNKELTIYTSLSITSASNTVTPHLVFPRCPKIIRTILANFSDWKFGDEHLPIPRPINAMGGREETYALCDEILNPRRRLPLIVISLDADEAVWNELPSSLANDLIALSQIYVIDEEGSWTLTDELGKQNSCYLGAVRLYWPITDKGKDPDSIVWTAGKLQQAFGESNKGLKKFCGNIRRMIMSTAALTLSAPKSLREIQNSATIERLKKLEDSARDEELTEIVEENYRLEGELAETKALIARLQWKINHLESQTTAPPPDDEESEPREAANDETHIQAKSGELRYYKKIGKKGDTDTLVVTAPCNHPSSCWTPAHKAIQAEKGLQKLEGRDDWRSMQHCSRCTGGGRWKVQW
ncbi:hypothetical protein [Pseudomonas nicosulfuronedens]